MLSLIAILPVSLSGGVRPLPAVRLAVMSHGKKISVEQWMSTVTVDHQRRWFLDGEEITTHATLKDRLTRARLQQHASFHHAYLRCRVDQSCPARDFLDFYAMAQECGFDRIVIAGFLE